MLNYHQCTNSRITKLKALAVPFFLSLMLISCSSAPHKPITPNNSQTTNTSPTYQSNGQLSNLASRQDVQQFIQNMVSKHGMNQQYLTQVFNQTEIKPSIIDAMNKPAESKTWAQYRPIFMTDKRIQGGVEFWHNNEAALQRAEQTYGVPSEYIIAIIGVETSYGLNKGKWRVIDALSTLAFEYPKRASYFSKELENFLVLSQQAGNKNIFSYVGSYAGALGYPQFMPSSYLSYAVDFDQDGQKDLWENTTDVIGSVANYFAKNGWKQGQIVATPTNINYASAAPYIQTGPLKAPNYTVAQLQSVGVQTNANLNAKALLLEYDGANGKEYWLGFDNFYVITRYNRSILYALAVHQLAEAIRAAK